MSDVSYRVNLLDEATVVARGQRVSVWFVPLGDGWVRAKDHPAAEIDEAHAERASHRCPPGTVWRREVELRLPPDTRIKKAVSSPHTEQLTPVQYLTRGRNKTHRKLEEHWYRVAGNYRLVKTSPPETRVFGVTSPHPQRGQRG